MLISINYLRIINQRQMIPELTAVYDLIIKVQIKVFKMQN